MRKEAIHLIIHGQVQGVGFRYFAQDAAVQLGLAGWVCNMPNGSVEAYAEGSRNDLETWVKRLQQGPPLSRVDALAVDWPAPQGTITGFSVQ